MSGRQLESHDYGLLKNATRKLVQLAGGLEKAARKTRVQKSALASYYDPDSMFFIPIDVVADLEASSGELPVTQALALSRGLYLQQVKREHDSEADNLPERLGEVASDVGEVFRNVGIALAREGQITPKLATECRTAIHDTMSELAALEILVNEKSRTR